MRVVRKLKLKIWQSSYKKTIQNPTRSSWLSKLLAAALGMHGALMCSLIPRMQTVLRGGWSLSTAPGDGGLVGARSQAGDLAMQALLLGKEKTQDHTPAVSRTGALQQTGFDLSWIIRGNHWASYHSSADLHELLPDANSTVCLSLISPPNILEWLALKSPLIFTACYKPGFMQGYELSVGDIRFQGLAN